MRRLALLFLAAGAAMASACTGTVQTRGAIVATTSPDPYYEPDLVYVSPGVSVIADYDEPVFFSDNFYWRYNGGRWYRSSNHDRGWTYYSAPPTTITRIERPNTYRHYRPHGYTVRRNVDRGRPTRGPTVRDHRDRR